MGERGERGLRGRFPENCRVVGEMTLTIDGQPTEFTVLEMTVSDVRQALADVVNTVQFGDNIIVIATYHGKPKAAVVSTRVQRSLEALDQASET